MDRTGTAAKTKVSDMEIEAGTEGSFTSRRPADECESSEEEPLEANLLFDQLVNRPSDGQKPKEDDGRDVCSAVLR